MVYTVLRLCIACDLTYVYLFVKVLCHIFHKHPGQDRHSIPNIDTHMWPQYKDINKCRNIYLKSDLFTNNQNFSGFNHKGTGVYRIFFVNYFVIICKR